MGIFSSLFGGNKEPSDSSMSVEYATKIAGAYGNILENNAPVPGTFADTSKLPYPKPIIKQALTLLLSSNTDMQINEHIKTAYLLLADWQEGIGPTNVGLDITSMDISADPVQLAGKIASQDNDIEKWQTIANEERQRLKTELDNLQTL